MLRKIPSLFRRVTASGNYLPEVDGLRFICILWVLLLHAYGFFLKKSGPYTGGPADYKLWNYIIMRGAFGVNMFFCISGFVLAMPFARWRLAEGKPIRIGNYYKRRLIRFEAPYFVCMLIGYFGYVYLHPGHSTELTKSLLASLVYLHQLIFHRLSPINAATWSLEYEVQFYLLAPFLFRCFRLPAAQRWWVWSVLYLLSILQLQYMHPPFRSMLDVFPFFLAGIMLADIYISAPELRLDSSWAVALAVMCGIFILLYPWTPLFWGLAPLALLVFYLVVLRNKWLQQLFSTPFLAVTGGMCYSIYLVHYYIISITGGYILRLHPGTQWLPNMLLQALLMIILAIAGSAVFYLLIEKPFMKLSARQRR